MFCRTVLCPTKEQSYHVLYWIRSLFFDKIAFRRVHASAVGHLGLSRVPIPTHAPTISSLLFFNSGAHLWSTGPHCCPYFRLLSKLVFRFQHLKLLYCWSMKYLKCISFCTFTLKLEGYNFSQLRNLLKKKKTETLQGWSFSQGWNNLGISQKNLYWFVIKIKYS